MINKPKRANKFRECDIYEMARLVTECKMTETDAAITLGFTAQQWHCWKNRNKRSAKFESLIAHTRGKMVDNLISKIKLAGEDQEITLPNGKIINKRGDWHAPAWLLEKTAPQFKADNGSAPPTTVSIQIGLVHDQLKRVIGFANPSANTLLPAPCDIVVDNESGQLKSHLNKLKMPVRRKVD